MDLVKMVKGSAQLVSGVDVKLPLSATGDNRINMVFFAPPLFLNFPEQHLHFAATAQKNLPLRQVKSTYNP